MRSCRGVLRIFLAGLVMAGGFAWGDSSGTIRGIIHDPQHRPITDARVTVESAASKWSETIQSKGNGEFEADDLPPGNYKVTVNAAGFLPLAQQIEVTPSKGPILHFQLELEIGRAHV